MIPDGIRYRRLCPWLNLFHAIGLALSIRQLIVAGLGLTVLALLQSGLAQFDTAPRDVTVRDAYGRVLIATQVTLFPRDLWLDESFAGPWRGVIMAGSVVVAPSSQMAERISAGLSLLVAVAVWSVFGLILCRLAARRFALREQSSFRRAVQFGVSRCLSAMIAPLLPTAAASLILLGVFVGLLCGWLPVVGSTVVWLASPGILLASLLAAFLFVATGIGWPLMIAAVATDDCDGFGGLSRSYSLWTGKLWYFLWCWAVAGLGAGAALMLMRSLVLVALTLLASVSQAALDAPLVALLISTISLQAALFLQVYAISLFWTSTTLVYAVLRLSIDGMPLDNVAPDDEERPVRDPLPVAGVAAMP